MRFDVPEHVAAARHLPTRLRGAKSSARATTAPLSSIAIAARLLHDQHIGALVVSEDGATVPGIITARRRPRSKRGHQGRPVDGYRQARACHQMRPQTRSVAGAAASHSLCEPHSSASEWERRFERARRSMGPADQSDGSSTATSSASRASSRHTPR